MLDPLGAIQLGSLTLTNFMITLLLTVIGTLVVLSKWLKREEIEEPEQVMSHVQNGLLIAIIIYKIWPFILSPTLILEPRNFIIYSGGPWAIEAAVLLGAFWVIIQGVLKKWPMKLLNIFSATAFVGFILYSLLLKEIGQPSMFPIGWRVGGDVYHPVNLYKAITYSTFLFFTLHWINRDKVGGIALFLFLSFIITKYLLAPFSNLVG